MKKNKNKNSKIFRMVLTLTNGLAEKFLKEVEKGKRTRFIRQSIERQLELARRKIAVKNFLKGASYIRTKYDLKEKDILDFIKKDRQRLK